MKFEPRQEDLKELIVTYLRSIGYDMQQSDFEGNDEQWEAVGSHFWDKAAQFEFRRCQRWATSGLNVPLYPEKPYQPLNREAEKLLKRDKKTSESDK